MFFTQDIWTDCIFCMLAVSRGVGTMGYYSPGKKKKKCFWTNHYGSWLFFSSLSQWEESITGLLPVKTQDGGNPQGQGPCPWNGPEQPQCEATHIGTLERLVREGGGSSSYTRWESRGVTQLLRFTCRFSRTELLSTYVAKPREQSPWSSKQTEVGWWGQSPQAQAVNIIICFLHHATQYYFYVCHDAGGQGEGEAGKNSPGWVIVKKKICSWASEHPAALFQEALGFSTTWCNLLLTKANPIKQDLCLQWPVLFSLINWVLLSTHEGFLGFWLVGHRWPITLSHL